MTSREAGILSRDFEDLFREHSEFVYRTAFRVTGRAEDAEDVLQTLFVRLLQQDRTAEFARNPKAYLYRAAVNTSLNVIRSRRRRNILALEEPPADPAAWRDAAVQHALQEELRAAMAELTPKTAEIFILRHVHGYSDREIGELLGISRGTIAVTLFRARARLRRQIRKSGGTP